MLVCSHTELLYLLVSHAQPCSLLTLVLAWQGDVHGVNRHRPAFPWVESVLTVSVGAWADLSCGALCRNNLMLKYNEHCSRGVVTTHEGWNQGQGGKACSLVASLADPVWSQIDFFLFWAVRFLFLLFINTCASSGQLTPPNVWQAVAHPLGTCLQGVSEGSPGLEILRPCVMHGVLSPRRPSWSCCPKLWLFVGSPWSSCISLMANRTQAVSPKIQELSTWDFCKSWKNGWPLFLSMLPDPSTFTLLAMCFSYISYPLILVVVGSALATFQGKSCTSLFQSYGILTLV